VARVSGGADLRTRSTGVPQHRHPGLMSVTLVGGPRDGLEVRGDYHGHTIYCPLLKEPRPENWHEAHHRRAGADPLHNWPEDYIDCTDRGCGSFTHYFYKWAYVRRDGEYRYAGETPS
jgi:hypothetical protein